MLLLIISRYSLCQMMGPEQERKIPFPPKKTIDFYPFEPIPQFFHGVCAMITNHMTCLLTRLWIKLLHFFPLGASLIIGTYSPIFSLSMCYPFREVLGPLNHCHTKAGIEHGDDIYQWQQQCQMYKYVLLKKKFQHNII